MFRILNRGRIGQLVLPSMLLLFFFVACITPSVVHMGPPHDRYDHNRTQIIESWAYGKWNSHDEPEQKTLELDRLNKNEVYSPYGDVAAPRGLEEADGIPSANLVPIYTGVLLPLSDEAKWELSDRKDLIDYLGQGVMAHHGVEAPETAAALPGETEKKYKAILDLLSSKEALSTRAGVMKWAEDQKIKTTFNIFDARYLSVSFSDRLALSFDDFWFILYAVTGKKNFTRLVVVPQGPGEEREKKPTEGGE